MYKLSYTQLSGGGDTGIDSEDTHHTVIPEAHHSLRKGIKMYLAGGERNCLQARKDLFVSWPPPPNDFPLCLCVDVFTASGLRGGIFVTSIAQLNKQLKYMLVLALTTLCRLN